MIFDTHCHLGIADEAADPIHERAQAAGVSRMLTVGIDLASSTAARDLARRLAGVEFTAGLHPNSADCLDAEWSQLAALCRENDCRAVGETGLDRHWQHTTPEQQARSLHRHLELAATLARPVVIHCREAFSETFEILAGHATVIGVMHCFAGGVDEARRALDLGYYLSFAGPLTYRRSEPLRAAARFAPEDRVLVETDAPFLPPQDRRGQVNEPAYIRTTLATLADLRGQTLEQMAAITMANGCRLFGL